jgi:ABC-type transport system involved in cytochrome bd biosynthesis fused ATPase/permease subunit
MWKPFKDREEAKEQLKRCGRWLSISENLSFLLVVIAIIWRVLKIDYGLDSSFWFLLAIFFAICSLAPHLHIASLQNLLGIDSEHK